jgi:hypothetical protein
MLLLGTSVKKAKRKCGGWMYQQAAVGALTKWRRGLASDRLGQRGHRRLKNPRRLLSSNHAAMNLR